MSTLLRINSNQLNAYLDQLKADYKTISISKITESCYKIDLSNLINDDLLILIN